MTAANVRPVAIKIDEDITTRVKRLADARERTSHWLIFDFLIPSSCWNESLYFRFVAQKGKSTPGRGGFYEVIDNRHQKSKVFSYERYVKGLPP